VGMSSNWLRVAVWVLSTSEVEEGNGVLGALASDDGAMSI
jgi:hypothetical protein